MSIYPPILLGRTIIAPKMPPSDKKRILIYKKKYSTFVLEIEWKAERVQKLDFIFDGKQ